MASNLSKANTRGKEVIQFSILFLSNFSWFSLFVGSIFMTLVTKMYLCPQNQPSWCFVVIHWHVQSSGEDAHLPSWGWTRWYFAMVQLSYCKQLSIWGAYCKLLLTYMLFVHDFAIYSFPQVQCLSIVLWSYAQEGCDASDWEITWVTQAIFRHEL